MDLNLKGKNALITGGIVGIGLAIANGLAAEGVNVVICGRDEKRVKEQATNLAQMHPVHVIGISADVTNVSLRSCRYPREYQTQSSKVACCIVA